MHEGHAERVPALCRDAGFETAEARKDLAGLWRYTVARMAGRAGPA
jgi:release factor glutamine methyltransferase